MAAFWLTNRIANPMLRRVLRTRAGRRLGRHLAVVRYRGRRTGRLHELVVQYAREGTTAWVLVGLAPQKTWWRNLRDPADVELWLAGEHLRGRAVVVDGARQPEEAAAGLAVYRTAVPRAAADRLPDAAHAVLVRADLDAG